MPIESPAHIELPDKLYFRVGEASSIVGVPAYVLRFWESEFHQIRPKRTPSGQRLYRKKDIETILKIKHLLHDQKFTIRGAKQHLRYGNTSVPPHPPKAALDEIKEELRQIRDLLS